MARTFGSGTSITVGTGQIPTSDQFTLLAVCRITSLSATQNIFSTNSAGGVSQLSVTSAGRFQNRINGSSSSWSTSHNITATSGWFFVAMSKNSSAGISNDRRATYLYETGAPVTSLVGTSLTGSTDTYTEAYLGAQASNASPLLGDMAAVGIFRRYISNQDDLLRYAFSLSSWLTLGPGAMWVLDQASSSVPVLDWTGGGANQTAITGTSVATTSRPISYGHPAIVATQTTPTPWLNQASGTAPRNAGSSHTIPFGFTSAAGSRLVAVVFGAVTHDASSGGWSEPLEPTSSGELSVFTKVSTGDSSITVAHNGSNYPVHWCVFEFPAGTSYTGGVGSSTSSETFPALTGLPGTAQVVIAARGRTATSASETGASAAWDAPWAEVADLYTGFASSTDGGSLTVGYQAGVTATSVTPSATTTYGGSWSTSDREKVVFAVALPTGGPVGVAETVTVSDAVTRGPMLRARAVAETATAGDALTRVAARARSLAESVTVSDWLKAAYTFFRDADWSGAGEFLESEVWLASEMTVPAGTFPRFRWRWPAVAPVVTPAIQVFNSAGTLVAGPVPFDSNTLSASNWATPVTPVVVPADTYRITVNTTRYPAMTGFFTSGPITRGPITGVRSRFGPPGSAPATPTTTAYFVEGEFIPSSAPGSVAAETVTVLDAVTRGPMLRARAVAETATAGDTVARVVVRSRGVAEAVTVADAVVRAALARPRGVAETVTVVDAVARGPVGMAPRALAETVSAVDGMSRTVARLRGVAEAVQLVDAVARGVLTQPVRGVVDAVTVVDAVSRTGSGVVSVVETVTVVDAAVRGALGRARGLVETVTAVDGIVRGPVGRPRDVAEMVTVLDVVTRAGSGAAAAAVAVAVADQVGRVSGLVRSAGEVLAVSNTVAVVSGSVRGVPEAVTVAVSIGRGPFGRVRLVVLAVQVDAVATSPTRLRPVAGRVRVLSAPGRLRFPAGPQIAVVRRLL